MKIVTFTPYGETTPGHGTIYMMSRYLHSLCVEVSQLHCNGTFSMCDRDLDYSEGRSLGHCLRCSSEQRNQAQFAGAKIQRISDFLNPEDLQRTREWMLERDAETIWNENWYGFNVSYLMKESFQRVSGEMTPRFNSKIHSGLVKKLSLVAVRMAIAAGRCMNRLRPDWVFVYGGNEVLSKTLYTIASETGKGSVVRFQAAPDGEMILAYRDQEGQGYRLSNIAKDLSSVRPEIDTWSKDLLMELDDFLGYLGISVSQLGLPVAR